MHNPLPHEGSRADGEFALDLNSDGVDQGTLELRVRDLERTVNDLRAQLRAAPSASGVRKRGQITVEEDPEIVVLKQAALGHLSTAVVLLDAHGYVVEVNPAFSSLLGFTGAFPFLGRPFSECCAHPHASLVISPEVRQRGKWEGELELRRGDGRTASLDGSARPIPDAAGRILGTVITFGDSAEFKLTEAALRESEAHSRIFVENALEGIIIHDENNLVNYVSPSAATILGYEPTELIGMMVSEFMRPPVITPMRPDDGSIGLPYGTCFERICQRKDGSERVVEATENVLVVDWNIVGFVINFRDVTRQQLAEARLAKAHHDYVELLENLPALIWRAAPSGEVAMINPHLAAYAGPEIARDVSQIWEILVHPDDLPRMLHAWQRAVGRESAFHEEIRLRTPAGDYRACVNTATPLRNPEGALSGFIGCLSEEFASAG